MSILSDVLSTIKHPQLRRDIPPGLKSTVFALKKKELNKRRVIILLVLATIALGSGFVTVYLMQTYLTGYTKQGNTPPAKPSSYSQKPSQSGTTQITKQTTKKVDSQQPLVNTQKRRLKTVETLVIVHPPSNPPPPMGSPESFRDSTGGLWLGANGSKRRGLEGGSAELLQTLEPGKEMAREDILKDEKPMADTSEKDLYLYMGENYEKKGDYSGAISSYKKVLDIEPRNYRVMNKLAYILIQIALPEEALKYLKKALNLRPDYVPALINTGIVYAKAEKFSDAEECLSKALAIEEANQTVLFNIAMLYEKQGKYDLARRHYSRLQSLGNIEGNLSIERIKALTTLKK